MRSPVSPFACLLALTMNAQASADPASLAFTDGGVPEGFGELAGSREVLVDVYFGDRKIAETLAVIEPGLLRFRDPAVVAASLPQVSALPELASALGGDLPVNASAICSKSNAGNCGTLQPETAGIIYDEDHFRVDVFVNPRFLATVKPGGGDFLSVPSAPLSLTSALGLAAAGTLGGRNLYNIQNRTVIGFRNARIRTSNSLASKLGWVVDDFVGEVDRRDLRYSAGIFWVPGNDFTGQRRMIGAGVGTQFDTWADQETLEGTPLVLFLSRPARVELLVDGRLVSSRSYAAGNNELDTSPLADGSYSVLMRIHEENGSVREERRFFVKNAHVAPVGHPIYFAYAGLLANTQPHHPVSLGSTLYYQGGVAWRLNNAIAVDIGALGTQKKAMVEAGGWLIQPFGRIRLAGLASTSGDAGALVQLASGGQGLLNFSLDLRRVWSHDGKPLIPLPSFAQTFDTDRPTGVQLASGSYSQAIGSVGLRLGAGYLSLVGSYRKDRNSSSDYNIGPNISWPLVTRSGLQLVFDASAQRTRTTTAGFAGVRVLYTSGALSMLSTVGRSVEDDRTDPQGATSRSTGSFTAQYSHETDGGSLLSGEIGTDRNIASSTVHAGATMTSNFGNGRVDMLHNLEGGSGTQYDLSFQSGLALSAHGSALGARQAEQSAMIVSVEGDAASAQFSVLVDDTPRGRVRVGQSLSLFVPAYHRYRVRLVPVEAGAVDFDAGAREITLYPGNVQSLRWAAQSYFTLIAQAVSPAGAPIVNALVESKKGVAETDANGYFQIDMRRDDPIRIARNGAAACLVRLPDVTVRDDYASVGKVVCQ